MINTSCSFRLALLGVRQRRIASNYLKPCRTFNSSPATYSNYNTVVSIPPFVRLTEFCKRIPLDKKAVMKQVGVVRKNRKIFWQDKEGRSFRCSSLRQVVLPYSVLEGTWNKKKKNWEVVREETDVWNPTLSPAPTAEVSSETHLVQRIPTVVVLGHIDHGKTTLVDRFRDSGTPVAESEPGGITQEIYANTVALNGTEVTFLDTPGHAHFFQMRKDSARVATAALLVVATDIDELPDQTIESINCLAHLKVPAVVVLNKIDKPNADPQRTRQLLEDYGLLGDNGPLIGGEKPSVVELSGLLGTNVHVLEQVLAETLTRQNLLAYGEGHHAEGIVLEAHNNPGGGALLRIVLLAGILKVGQPYVSGRVIGAVRTLSLDESNNLPLQEARPGQVVYVSGSKKGVGLSKVPPLGEPFFVMENKQRAQQLIDYRKMLEELAGHQLSGPPLPFISSPEEDNLIGEEESSNEEEEEEEEKEASSTEDDYYSRLPIVVRASSAGKLEAILVALDQAGCVQPVKATVGPLLNGDVLLASEERIPLVSYGQKVRESVRKSAKQKEVPIMEDMVMYGIVQAVVEHAKSKGYKPKPKR